MLSTPDWTNVESILQKTDFLFINAKEADFLQGLLSISIMDLCHISGISIIIITMGDIGCMLLTNERETLIPALKVDNVLDTTGAGDAFAGTFIASIVVEKNKSIEKCVSMACNVSSQVVQILGTRVDSAMRKHIHAACNYYKK
jgi:sugar/nucleoside kinase (ribokinase family)